MSGRLLLADPGLTTLARALDGASAAELLAALPGTPRPCRVRAVEIIKHKPGRRCALAYHMADGTTLFAKVFANDRGARIVSTMARIADALRGDDLIVPQPLGWIPEMRLMVTEFIEGAALAPFLYAGRSTEPAERMALAAAALHGCGVRWARRWDPAKELRNTEEWIRGLRGRGGRPGFEAASLLEALRAWAAGFGGSEETTVHRDFYADQLWDARGRTALLDLDDARWGDPAVDVGNFLAHLVLRPLQFEATRDGCVQARDAFIRTYLERRRPADGERSWRNRVAFYEASTLLRLAGVYASRDRWAVQLPPRLLQAARRVVAEHGF